MGLEYIRTLNRFSMLFNHANVDMYSIWSVCDIYSGLGRPRPNQLLVPQSAAGRRQTRVPAVARSTQREQSGAEAWNMEPPSTYIYVSKLLGLSKDPRKWYLPGT